MVIEITIKICVGTAPNDGLVKGGSMTSLTLQTASVCKDGHFCGEMGSRRKVLWKETDESVCRNSSVVKCLLSGKS